MNEPPPVELQRNFAAACEEPAEESVPYLREFSCYYVAVFDPL